MCRSKPLVFLLNLGILRLSSMHLRRRRALCHNSLIHSINQSINHSFIHSFIRSIARSFIRSFVQSLVHSIARSFIRSFIQSLVHSIVHSLTRSFIPSHPSILVFTNLPQVVRVRQHVARLQNKALQGTKG